MRFLRPLIFAVAAALTACDDPSGPDSRYLGYIATEEMLPEINVMQVDSALFIDVHTFGFNSCHVRAAEDVEVSGRTITVRPYDRIEGDECADEMVTISHQLLIDVDEEGTWTVRVEGTHYDGVDNDPVTFEVEYDVALDVTDG